MTMPAQISPRVATLLKKTRASRGRLIFACDATESRAPTWFSDAHELVRRMGTIKCMAGATKIARILRHIRSENEREKVSAAIFIGDAVEETPSDLYDAAASLSVPLFCFQEGDTLAMPTDRYGMPVAHFHTPPQTVEQVFRELARLSNGAYGKFDAGAAGKLGELLRAVAAFAVGGITALTNQNSDSARRLLSQMRGQP
jgi:hypothetical protein